MRKKWIAMLLVVCLCLGNILPANASDTIVNIPDENLKSTLTASGPGSIDKNQDGEISKSEITGLTYLYMNGSTSNEEIDLTGLEYATNLWKIDISGYVVKSLAPLKELEKLTTLSVKCKDVSALSELTRLETVILKDSNITEVPSLEKMQNLNSIDFSNNNISDITKLSAYEGVVYLEGNPIADIQPLKDFNGTIYLSSSDVVTWEKMFELCGAEGQKATIIKGNPLLENCTGKSLCPGIYLDGAAMSDSSISFDIVDTTVASMEDGKIVGRAEGNTDYYACVGNVKKLFHLTVVEKEAAVENVLKGKVQAEKLLGNACAVLDDNNTLWSINTEKVELVKPNIKQYIGNIVYGENNMHWGDYYALDEENILWKSEKQSYEQTYQSKIWFENVKTFDEEYVLLENGELYTLETREKKGENIKKYYCDFYDYLKDIYAITKDGKLVEINSGKIYFENVEDAFISMDQNELVILSNQTLYFYELQKESYLLRESVSNVNGFLGERRFVKNDGSEWGWTYLQTTWNAEILEYNYTVDLYESTGTTPISFYIDDYNYTLDSNNILWKRTGDYGTGYVYQQRTSGVQKIIGRYYLKTDGTLWEIRNDNDIYIIGDVSDFGAYEHSPFEGNVYIIRNDGSIWTNASYLSKWVPWKIKDGRADVSGDGDVTIKDVQMIFAHISGTTELTDSQIQLADVNRDGKVTANDMQRIFYFVNGKIDEL